MLLPVTYRVNERGRADVGGCDLVALAQEFGTPLYVYDEATVRDSCRAYVAAMAGRGEVMYSAKAFASPGFLRVVASEGLGLDVVSEGELHLALASGYPTDRIHFLGNNKSLADVAAAAAAGATLVIDGFRDLDLIAEVVPRGGRLRCEVRVAPGVQAATHDFIATGHADSKFGFPIASGEARSAVERALGSDRVDLRGLHSHIGSQITNLGGHLAAMVSVLDLAQELHRDLGWSADWLSAGGGLGIAYAAADDPPTPNEFVEALLAGLVQGCADRDLAVPRLVVEPGRSIAGPAGVALYSVGSIKDAPGGRRFVAVDGGMGDNIRPGLYGARYEVLAAGAPEAAAQQRVTVVGKYCESTDVLVEEARLPAVAAGDVLCLPAAGAYCLSMASQYNGIPRPAVVMVSDGQARPLRRRETLDDLLLAEVF
ncbi:MAG: diaminopimelate decarboxylase [Candidatus Dormibacteraeota bacterium]|nr:diaminopimelate decarboxylase [Candidatus Dormibacteraeota bacterium]